MASKQVSRNKGGRPVGSGHGTQTVHMVRRQFEQALDIIKRDKNITLAELLANGLTESTASMNATLSTIARFMPKDVDVNITGGSFADALASAAEIMRSNEARPIIIEQETPGNNITDIDNNVTQKETSEN